MNWKNGEQYEDYTAAEAMLRAMGTPDGRADRLDDGGCRLLVEAVVRQAVEDCLSALRRPSSCAARDRLRDTEGFFRSDYFRCLTGLDGNLILRMIRKEVNRE